MLLVISCDVCAGCVTFSFLFKEQLVETFLGGPRFVAAELKLRHGYLFPLSCRMLAGSATHVVGFRPRCAHPQATGCLRWQLDAGFTIVGVMDDCMDGCMEARMHDDLQIGVDA